MSKSLIGHIKSSIGFAKKYNASQVTSPEVVLWPDPEKQWLPVIDRIRQEFEAFLTLGEYNPSCLEGPAIWLKCMVDKMLPEANWSEGTIPVIYLPGVSKADFKNIDEAPFSIQPLMEYQFTGNLWTQENGKEWTVLAFMQNADKGMGLEVAKDQATKEAILKSLPNFFEDGEILYRKKIDADFLNQLMFPEVIPTLINWIEKGDEALSRFPLDQQEAFKDVIKSQYQIKLDYSLVLDFVRAMGSRKDTWNQVWQYFANAPHKYPNIVKCLHDAKPDDLGGGFFKIPESSWPQVNQEKELQLQKELLKLKKATPESSLVTLEKLYHEHKERQSWIWTELEQSPLVTALPSILDIAKYCTKPYDNSTIEKLTDYYDQEGVRIDRAVRKIYTISSNQDYLKTMQVIIDLYYRPWLEKLTERFQHLANENYDFLYANEFKPSSKFILFVDAFRYDLAVDFCEQLSDTRFEHSFETSWSAIPSLTPTSKPSVSPIIGNLSKESEWNTFQAQLKTGKPLSHHYFKSSLADKGVQFISSSQEIEDPEGKYWLEIGDIDKKGHQEQEAMLKRIPDLLKDVRETVDAIVKKGVRSIQIVTDHGWLLLPGGLPKASLHKDLVETRWGRCALIKEGVSTDLLHLPWTWNPHTYIAFAPGISFFKKNEVYAHGGISLHECLTPRITIKAKSGADQANGSIDSFEWRGMRLYVRTLGANEQYSMDIRTKFDEPKSSVIIKASWKDDNQMNIMVNSDYEGQAATLILLNESGIIIDKKLLQIGG
jgi:hypothetical protein